MKNEPVAWRRQLDTGVYMYQEYYFGEAEPLYTNPAKELNDGGEPVKNATYWKRQYNLMASQNDNLKSGLYHANEQIKYLESHPVKEPAICVGHWDYKTGAFHKVLTESQQKRVDEGFLQPVYTAGMLPIKELTDEEILICLGFK